MFHKDKPCPYKLLGYMDIVEELYTLAFGLVPYNTYFPCVAAAGKLYAQMQPSGAAPAVIS